MNHQPKGKTVFRRIGGRIVPIQVRNEASAVMKTKKEIISKPSAMAPIAKALAYTGAGFAMAFGAGKLKKLSELALKLNPASRGGQALERTAKITDFVSKGGTALLVGTEVTKADRALHSDEKSRILNFGAGASTPIGIAGTLALGYGTYRLSKRFTKWGYYGGKFPKKLRDI